MFLLHVYYKINYFMGVSIIFIAGFWSQDVIEDVAHIKYF